MLLKTKAKTPFAGRRSKKFPNGIGIGMYTNSCGKSEPWVDTKDRHPEKICCRNGKHTKCPEKKIKI